MAEELFRKKSIDRVSSPESLNDYVRVVNPGIWLMLFSIIFLLIGICAYGVLGHLDTNVEIVLKVVNGKTTGYVSAYDIDKLKNIESFEIDGEECKIVKLSNTPLKATSLEAFICYSLSAEENDWIYTIECESSLEDGEYSDSIVIESVSPISFVVN